MSEQALLPGSVELEEASKSNSRVVLMAVGAGVLALFVAVYFLFFTGGGSDAALSAGPLQLPKTKVHTTTKTAAKPAAKKQAAVVPATFAGVHSKDPFKPLIDPPPAPVATSAPAPGTPGDGTTSAAPAQTLTLTNVSPSSASVMVNGVSFKPALGSQFATYFKLQSVQGSCATFLYGDESFDLCKGHTATKQ